MGLGESEKSLTRRQGEREDGKSQSVRQLSDFAISVNVVLYDKDEKEVKNWQNLRGTAEKVGQILYPPPLDRLR